MNLEDRAQEHEAALWEARQTPRPAAPQYEPGQAGYGPAECLDCGDDVPEFRRRHGWRRCTCCQTALEGVRRR